MTELGTGADTIIIVTAADARYFYLLDEMVSSLRAASGTLAFAIGCFDLGLTPEQIGRLQGRGVVVVNPTTGLKTSGTPETSKLSFLARPYLRENFPGYGIYVWLDADTWVQGSDWLRLLAGTARDAGAAFILENDPSYEFRFGLFLWKSKHYLQGYGPRIAARLLLKSQINNGVFAIRATAPHWALWQRQYQSALSRTGRAVPHDQFSLNVAVRHHGQPDRFLPPTFNWICDLARPHWDEDAQCFCTPDADRKPIHIIHLAGHIKTTEFDVKTTKGRILRGRLRYGGDRILVEAGAPATGVS